MDMMAKRSPRVQKGHCHKGPVEAEALYSCGTLLGNWYETRFYSDKDEKAITPAITGKSDCPRTRSETVESFKRPITVHSRDDCFDFIMVKHKAFVNKTRVEDTNICLIDSESYKHNMTSMHDIFYRMKREADIQRGKVGQAHFERRRKEDFLRSYGDSTNYGLREYKKCVVEREANRPVDISLYRELFKPNCTFNLCRKYMRTKSYFTK